VSQKAEEAESLFTMPAKPTKAEQISGGEILKKAEQEAEQRIQRQKAARLERLANTLPPPQPRRRGK